MPICAEIEEDRTGLVERWKCLLWARQVDQEEKVLATSPPLLHDVKLQENGIEGRRTG